MDEAPEDLDGLGKALFWYASPIFQLGLKDLN